MTYTTSPKHEDLTGVCIKTDASEIEKFGKRLQLACLLFTSNHILRNIVIMIVACPNANIYSFEWVGNNIMGDIILELAFIFKFKKTGPKPIFPDNISVILRFSPEEVLTDELSPSNPLWGQKHYLKIRRATTLVGNWRPCCSHKMESCNELYSLSRLLHAWWWLLLHYIPQY